MDQSLVHMNSWGNSYGPMILKVLLKFPPYTGIGPWMALPRGFEPEDQAEVCTCNGNSLEFKRE